MSENGGSHGTIAAAVGATLDLYFLALHSCDGDAFDKMFHPSGLLLGIGPDSGLVSRTHDEFRAGVLARAVSTGPEFTRYDKILETRFLDDRTAAAKVQIALPPAPESPTPTKTPVLYTDWLVLLREGGDGDDASQFRIISKIFSSSPINVGGDVDRDGKLDRSRPPVTADDLATAAKAVWDGYIRAGRDCDGDAMAKIFHPVSRLTFCSNNDERKVVVVESKNFCERVAHRWNLPDHAPYAHLHQDGRDALGDQLIGVDFCDDPNVAMVMLRVGFPPFLYTDVLSLLRVIGNDDDGPPRWWIVAKSSVHEPFLAEEERQVS